MKLFVRSGEREEEVEVEVTAGGSRVQIGERLYLVDRHRAGAFRSLIIDGQQYEVSLHRSGASSYHVAAGDFAGTVLVLDPLERMAGMGGAPGSARAAQQGTAYMPGRVVALLAAEGDTVMEGQGIVVLEAMKMQNEIQAEASGVIKAIHVQTGQAVESGDLLFQIAPAP